MCIAFALVLVNSLPLVELSTMSAASADESDGPDGISNDTKEPVIALEQNAGSRTTFPVFATSVPPIYIEGTLDEYANEHTVQQTMQVQATATGELGAGTLSASHRLTRGGYELIMSGPSISMHVNSSSDVWGASENEDLNTFVDNVRSLCRNIIIVLYFVC